MAVIKGWLARRVQQPQKLINIGCKVERVVVTI